MLNTGISFDFDIPLEQESEKVKIGEFEGFHYYLSYTIGAKYDIHPNYFVFTDLRIPIYLYQKKDCERCEGKYHTERDFLNSNQYLTIGIGLNV